MGNTNENLTNENIGSFAIENNINETKIRNMLKNFKNLDTTKKGYITKTDLISSLKISEKEEIYLKKLLENLTTNSSEKIDFKKLLLNLEIFSKNDKKEKLRFLFFFLDEDKDGFVNSEDLIRGFEMVKNNNIKFEDIREIAEQTLMYSDSSERGCINFEEFESFFNSVLQITI